MLAYLIDFIKLLGGIECAELGGEGDVNQSRMYGVIFIAIVHIVVEILVESLSLHLSVVVGDGDDFMLSKLHSTGLVYINVSAANTDYTLVLIQHRVDGGGVSLRAAG